MPRHADVRPWQKRWPENLAPLKKETPKFQLLRVSQNRETRQRIALAAADCRRKTPHATAAGAKLGNLFPGKFQNAIRRIGTNGMQRARLAIT